MCSLVLLPRGPANKPGDQEASISRFHLNGYRRERHLSHNTVLGTLTQQSDKDSHRSSDCRKPLSSHTPPVSWNDLSETLNSSAAEVYPNRQERPTTAEAVRPSTWRRRADAHIKLERALLPSQWQNTPRHSAGMAASSRADQTGARDKARAEATKAAKSGGIAGSSSGARLLQ